MTSAALGVGRRSGMLAWMDRAGVALVLLLLLFLLHGRALADIALSLIDVLFLVQCTMRRDWGWLGRAWVRLAAAWWGWLVLCSFRDDLGQALAVVRFPLLAAALGYWLLQGHWLRVWVARLLRWSVLYIGVQCLAQYAWGHNLLGWPKGADGELTGPYTKPRAGPVLSRILFPALLVWSSTRWRALAAMVGGVVLMFLVAQRMPLLLTLFGLVLTALLMRRARWAVLGAGVAAVLMLAALPVLSPSASHRVRTEFTAQMENFSGNHYGEIAARSSAIIAAHPVFGAGFDGFRRLCTDPEYFQGWEGGDGGGADMCVQHPHNFYMQAAVEGGYPGLALFVALALAWLLAIGRGIGGDPLRTGLFIAAAIHLWPIAGNTDWVAMPLAGYFFLQLGLALAYAADGSPRSVPA
ncbi:MAG: O-antigen ligase family protein [Acetobacteraceae bacterium]|nr:O-antigen ligase family protein [Acetobacteraceae bacterium]